MPHANGVTPTRVKRARVVAGNTGFPAPMDTGFTNRCSSSSRPWAMRLETSVAPP